MANSDNVLRGGLTPKHVDVDELLRVLTFDSGPVDVLAPRATETGEIRYETPAEEFSLARIEVSAGAHYEASAERAIEILLCTSGAGRIGEELQSGIARGDCLLVPAAAPAYRIEGPVTIYRATVGEAQSER